MSTPYYRVGQIITDTSTPPVQWRCMTAGYKTMATWAKISGGGGASLQMFKFVADVSSNGDYWTAKSWDGTTLGSLIINIIKPFKLRCSAANGIPAETIRGVVRTYTYVWDSTYLEWKRTTSGSDGSSSTDYCTPPMLASGTYGYDIIYAMPFSGTLAGIPNTIAAASVASGGTGYAVNDVLTVSGGTGTHATLKVTSVAAGVITGITVLTAGSYTANPTLTGVSVTGGTGSSATFNLTLAALLIDANIDARKWATGP